jgi:glutamyl-tRNA reductase
MSLLPSAAMTSAPHAHDGGDTVHVLGISHHKTPVAIRERLAFRADTLPKGLGSILGRGFREALILSTCNRVEIYTVTPDSNEARARLCEFLSEFHGIPVPDFSGGIYERHGADAITHIFEVAASLDSQILGETEILAQSKKAYELAGEHGAAGRMLRAVFERAFHLSKEIRCDGGIGRAQASVSSAAVNLARKLFELKNRKCLVVGTGEMATGIVRALKASGVNDVLVASRTEARAQEFAKAEGARACPTFNLNEYLPLVDIVLVSTGAPHFIIGPKEMEAIAAQRRNRTLCFIDISVPRNVDPAVHKYEDTFVYDIDDLEEVARDGRREREAVASRWRPRLAEEARELLRALRDSHSADTARKLLQHAAQVRAEIAAELGRGLDEKSAAVLARALERYQGKLLHGSLETLKQAAREGGGDAAAAWVARLFRLHSEAEKPIPAPAEPAQISKPTAHV